MMDGKYAEEITEKPLRERGNRSRWKLSIGVSVGKVSGKPAGSFCVHIRFPAAQLWNFILKTPRCPCSLSLDLRPGFILFICGDVISISLPIEKSPQVRHFCPRCLCRLSEKDPRGEPGLSITAVASYPSSRSSNRS